MYTTTFLSKQQEDTVGAEHNDHFTNVTMYVVASKDTFENKYSSDLLFLVSSH